MREPDRKQTVCLKKQKRIASEQDKATKAAEAEIAKLAILAARKIVKTGEANDTGSSK